MFDLTREPERFRERAEEELASLEASGSFGNSFSAE